MKKSKMHATPRHAAHLSPRDKQAVQRQVYAMQREIRLLWMPAIRTEVRKELKARKFSKKRISAKEAREIAGKLKRYPRDVAIVL